MGRTVRDKNSAQMFFNFFGSSKVRFEELNAYPGLSITMRTF